FGTSPLGVDTSGTRQQHFVLWRYFSLDINFAFDYIAPSDSGNRDFGARAAHPPREGRSTVSRNLPAKIETSRGLCSLPLADAPSAVGEPQRSTLGATSGQWTLRRFVFFSMFRNSWRIPSNPAAAC